MEQYKSFLNYKIVFRCDSADIPEIGTGHLYRSIIIAKFLKKKFSLKSKEILFVVKNKGKYSKNLKILKKYNFQILKINSSIKNYSSKEIVLLRKIKANLLIIDRLGEVTKNFYVKIKDNYKKKIIIDDSSINRKLFDLSLNPLIQDVPIFKGCKIGYKYLILDILKKVKHKTKNSNNIFLFFGGFDKKNLTKKVFNVLKKINFKLNIYLPKIFKEKIYLNQSIHNVIFFKSEKYFLELEKANIAITAGGIGLFDAILKNKKVICIPQYKHQEINAKKIARTKAINFINSDDKNFASNLVNIFLKIYKDKKYNKKINTIQKTIINIKKVQNTLGQISKIYEKSKN